MQATSEGDVKNFRAGGICGAVVGCATVFLLTVVLPGSSLAQRGSPGAAAAERRTDTLNRQGERYERDHLGQESKNTTGSPSDWRRAQDAAGQVKRDFEGLQAAYNRIVLAMRPEGTHDVDSILESVKEVKKCATRLRANLALPKGKDGEDKSPDTAGAARMEDSLMLLRKHIYSFVTNPLFETTNAVLNVEHARKAGRDLDLILELSESLAKRR
jgi:hypothetical protein